MTPAEPKQGTHNRLRSTPVNLSAPGTLPQGLAQRLHSDHVVDGAVLRT